jgi:L-glyceraldehyde 3-phosphate reductase
MHAAGDDDIGLARSRGQSLAQLALAWVLRQKAVTSVIIGASRVAQVEDGARTVDNLALSGDELRMIERALQG